LGEVALHQLVDGGEFHGFQAYYNLLNPSRPEVPQDSARWITAFIDPPAARGMGAFVIRILAAGALTSDQPRRAAYRNPIARIDYPD
jgi:hypothetical protein